jgi:hypothetical protein
MDEFFKQPTQKETDRQWLTQLCYDGQMADDEIEEFVKVVMKWARPKKVFIIQRDGVIHGCFYKKESAKKHRGSDFSFRVVKMKVE